MSINIEDRGIIISIQKHSESSAIVKILSQNHGIYSGYVRGALKSGKVNSDYQIANIVEFKWRSKNEDNLGFLKIELEGSYLAKIIFNNLKLSCVSAIFRAICDNVFEREPHEELYQEICHLFGFIDSEDSKFLSEYIKLEISLLKTLGYGIDLSECALTGKKENLYFISPRTGRAACKEAAIKYEDRLLRLPEFMSKDVSSIKNKDIFDGFNLAGHFLKKHLISNNQKFFELRSRVEQIAASKLA